MKKIWFVLILLISFGFYTPANAYIDPGTGSMLFSIVLGACSTLFFILHTIFIKIKTFSFKKCDLSKFNVPFAIYNEGNQYFNIFKPIIDEFESRKIPLVYYTSEKDDIIFKNEYKYVHSEYIGKGIEAYSKLAFLKADICLMTTPGLDVFQLKRSKFVKYYCHIFHAVASSMGYRLYSLDYYDAVLLNGSFQEKIIRGIESKRKNVRKKELKVVGCTYLDVLSEKLKELKIKKDNSVKTILLAPTWGESSIINKYGEQLIDKLVEMDCNIIIRPHPQSLKVEKNIIDKLTKKYSNCPNLSWDYEVENLKSLAMADIMISDFSGVIFDYAFLFNRPIVYVNNEVNREIYDYSVLDEEPWLYQKIRKIGVELTKENFSQIKNIIENLNQNETIEKEIYNAKEEAWQSIGESGKNAVDFLIKKQQELAGNDTNSI